jgi:hypothetical protein
MFEFTEVVGAEGHRCDVLPVGYYVIIIDI